MTPPFSSHPDLAETTTTTPAPAPRYLRFVTALVLGGALATVPALAGCGDDTPAPPTFDAGAIDARIIDAEDNVVDGPLAPPDLARLA